MKNPDHFYLIKAPRDLCAGQGPNRWFGNLLGHIIAQKFYKKTRVFVNLNIFY